MANNYTKEDKEAFRRKDWLSARQSAAKDASVIFEGQGIEIDKFIAYAEEIVKWIWQGQGDVPEPLREVKPTKQQKAILGTTPMPNLEEKKILDEIERKLPPTTGLYNLVLDWAEQKCGKRVYPKKQQSVNEFCEWYLERNKNE